MCLFPAYHVPVPPRLSCGAAGLRSIADLRVEKFRAGNNQPARMPLRRESVLEDERHLHGDPILGNLAVSDTGLLLEHMQPGNPTQRLAGAGQSLTHSIIEALR